MNKLETLDDLSIFSKNSSKMPMLFVGHGSPMNGIEDNSFSQRWRKLGEELPKPHAILCVSAHWLTDGTYVTSMPKPRTIHDFGGFPDELYRVDYPAPGDPLLAEETSRLVTSINITADYEWGLDHGTWTVVRYIFPEANIPVIQLSIDYSKPAQFHYDLGKQLAELRRKGVLIIGSGNLVHNLRMVDWRKLNDPAGFGYDWALEINELFKKHILEGNHQALIRYDQLGEAAHLAIQTPDHYLPLLYVLAMQERCEVIEFFNDVAVGGSLTMTSVKIQ